METCFFRNIGIAAATVFFSLLAGGCAVPEKTVPPPEPPAAVPPMADNIYARSAFVGAVMDFVSRHYVDPQKADAGKLMTGALRGMLRELDPYSTYIPPGQFAAGAQLTGEGVGVGLTVSRVRPQGFLVVGVVPGSPAARARIRPGDVILEVDGRRMQHLDLEDLLTALRGKPGTAVRLTILSPGRSEPVQRRVVRKAFIINPVPLHAVRYLPDGIGYVRVERFNLHTVRGLQAAISHLQQQGNLKALIIDLRNNPGGMVDAAVDMVSQFLEPGKVIFTAVGRDKSAVQEKRTLPGKQAWTELPLAVLVNEFSASASEITAGALKDHKRAIIAGGRTFGKGAIQEIRKLPNGGAIRYTTAYYRTPGGIQIDGVGVTPDVPVKVSRAETFRLARLQKHPGAGKKKNRSADKALTEAVKKLQETLRNEL